MNAKNIKMEEQSLSSSIAADAVLPPVLESIKELVIYVSSFKRIEYINKAAMEFYGITDGHLQKKNWFELFATMGLKVPVDAEMLEKIKKPKMITDSFIKNEKHYAIEWKISPIPQGRDPLGYLLIGSVETFDLELGFAKNLSQILNSTPGSLYWKNKEGRYLGCNQFMATTAGLNSINDIIGKTDFDLWPENARNISENDQAVMQSGQTAFLEEEVKISNGDTLYFTGVKMPLRNEKNEVIGVIGNSLDITKLKKVEKELKTAKEKAESVSLLKAEFIRNMEHDIRTPFHGMMGITNLLAEREPDPGKKAMLTDVFNCAKQLLDYCNGILDFSRIESGFAPVQEKPFDVLRVIQDVIEMESMAAKMKNIELVLNSDPHLPKTVMSDPYRIKGILINLVSNAVKFTKEGSIKLTVELVKPINAERYIVAKFVVADTGIGIPEDKREMIYEKFSKVVPSNRGLYRGHGLGLRIVKQFVDELHGDIFLKTAVNQGTEFSIFLPLRIPLVENLAI